MEDPISETLLRGHPKLESGCTILVDLDNPQAPKASQVLVLSPDDVQVLRDPAKTLKSASKQSILND